MLYYTEKDFENIKNKTHMRVYAMLVLIVAVCAGMGVCCALRLRMLNFVIAGVGFIAATFLWNMKLTPWLRYNKFMKDMHNGQKRSLEVEFISIVPETRFYDGVEVHDFLTRVGSEEEDERLYVFDADKELPKLKEGQKIKVTSYGSFVVEINEL